jgi:hypothetical protein
MKHVYILATISYDSYDIIDVFRKRATAEEHWYHERDGLVGCLVEMMSGTLFEEDLEIDIAMYNSLTPDDISGADMAYDIPVIEKHEVLD